MISLFVCFFTQRKECQAELKIIIFFTYLLVYLLVVLCQDAVTIAWKEPYRNLTKSYFLCEAVGYVPGRCSREPLERYTYVISLLNCMYYIVTAFIPVIHLIFIINCRVLKQSVVRMTVVRSLKTSSPRVSQ